MILSKAILPDSITVSGKVYQIRTGHPYWFMFHELLGEERVTVDRFDIFYTGEIPEDKQAGIDELYKFYFEEKDLPRDTGEYSPPVLDYVIDADYIYAGILQCYGIDLFEKEYHWHKVRAMIAGLIGTRMNDIMFYRGSKSKDKETQKLKMAWELPPKVKTESEGLKKFNALFE